MRSTHRETRTRAATWEKGSVTPGRTPWAGVRRFPWAVLTGRQDALVCLGIMLVALALRAEGAARLLDLARRFIWPQFLPAGALVIDGWYSSEGLRYLQLVEGQRRDLELSLSAGHPAILAALTRGQTVYLLDPNPGLGLVQWLDGLLWRVGDQSLEAATPSDIRWGAGIVLTGYTLPAGPYQPGAIVPITLFWEARAAPPQPYMLFVHLIAADGTIRGQRDREPDQGPTDRWRPGARYVELSCPVLDPAAPPGRYIVNVGWYAYPSLRRLPIVDVAGSPVARDYVTLGEIGVVPSD